MHPGRRLGNRGKDILRTRCSRSYTCPEDRGCIHPRHKLGSQPKGNVCTIWNIRAHSAPADMLDSRRRRRFHSQWHYCRNQRNVYQRHPIHLRILHTDIAHSRGLCGTYQQRTTYSHPRHRFRSCHLCKTGTHCRRPHTHQNHSCLASHMWFRWQSNHRDMIDSPDRCRLSRYCRSERIVLPCRRGLRTCRLGRCRRRPRNPGITPCRQHMRRIYIRQGRMSRNLLDTGEVGIIRWLLNNPDSNNRIDIRCHRVSILDKIAMSLST